MNNNGAINQGRLANKPQFFGSSTAETVSAATTYGSWNRDDAYSVYSGGPWQGRGERSNLGASAGVFNFDIADGGGNALFGHRTILSGY